MMMRRFTWPHLALAFLAGACCVLAVLYLAPPQTKSTADVASDLDPLFQMSTMADGAFAETLAWHLGNAYRADSRHFISSLAQRPPQQIELSARLLSYNASYGDLAAFRRQVASHKAKTQAEQGVVDAILAAITMLEQGGRSPEPDRPVPSVGDITYTTLPLRVGERETLRVVFSEQANTAIERSYWIEVWCISDGEPTRRSVQRVVLGPGESTRTAELDLTFDRPETVYTLVRVLSESNGAYLTHRQGANPDTIH